MRKSYIAKTYGLFTAKITRLNIIFNYKKRGCVLVRVSKPTVDCTCQLPQREDTVLYPTVLLHFMYLSQ
jgi:hypothetical protein